MKKATPKARKGRRITIPKVIFKLADMSPEERQRRLDEVYEILFDETLKVFDK